MRTHRTDAPRKPGGERGHPGREPRRRTAAGPHPTTDSVLELQRTAGNRVTRRLLVGSGPVVAGAPVVQRRTYGLDVQASQDTYVALAVKLWKTQQTMSLVDFAGALLTAIGAELKTTGVPSFAWEFVTKGGAAGWFDSKAWKVKVNVAKFSTTTPAPAVLQDLDEDEVTDVVGTLYHEARHTDQDVVIIRSMLDQKQSPQKIFATTKIRRDVIDAVKATKYATPLDADQVAQAKLMSAVMYGAHKELLEFLMTHADAYDGLAALGVAGSALAPADPHIKTLATWQSTVLKRKVTTMAANKNLTTVEADLLTRLQAVDAALTTLRAAWKKAVGPKKPVQADVDAVHPLAEKARAAVADAYTNLEGEKDAFRVEQEVKDAFGPKIATP